MLRRDFLQISAGLTVALATPGALAQGNTPAGKAAAAGPARWDRILVLVELKGANDGLNTVIPYADPAYQPSRPAIAIPRERVVQLDQRVGLHPALKGLMESWQ